MKNIKAIISIVLSILCVLCLVSCGNTEEVTTETPVNDSLDLTESTSIEDVGIWSEATYTENKEFGEGAKTVICEVKAEDKTVTFTVKTDKETVGEALLEHGIVEGDEGPYGLYIKKVNGIVADYDINQCYWAFYIDGEMAMTGVDGTAITENVTYQLVYSK